MSEALQLSSEAALAFRPGAGSSHASIAGPRAELATELVDAQKLHDIGPAWRDLLTRAASQNVFMDPAMLAAAAQVFPDLQLKVLLAWQIRGGSRHLVGLFACAIAPARRSIFPLRVLNAPPFEYGYLATPVIDKDRLEETLHLLLDRIAGDPDLPKVISFDSLAADDPTMAALRRVLAARGSQPIELQRFVRPILQSKLEPSAYLANAMSASSRKKLRQHRRRLAEQGVLVSRVVRDPQGLGDALEQFLRLEAAGWKGRRGTALLCNAQDAAFARNIIAALGTQDWAAIHVLELNEQPVSMQIVFVAGQTAFTWKTAYDEAFRDYSPGMLLFEDYTTALLADPDISLVDSCAYDETSFMSAWTERRPVADMLIDTRRGGSLELRLLGFGQLAYRRLREAAKRAYLHLRNRKS